jgi:hypothetical protein
MKTPEKLSALEKALYADMKALMLGAEIYEEIKPMLLDPIEIALMEWRKQGNKPVVIKYRKARKSEYVQRIGMKS